jgi:hypothetical protein
MAAETGWPEERILFMALARLAQYQHCLLRRNGVVVYWSGTHSGSGGVRLAIEALRDRWRGLNPQLGIPRDLGGMAAQALDV